MKKRRIIISITFSIALLLSSVPLTWTRNTKAANNYGLENPKVAYLTRDIVEFGHYWQEDTNGDGKADKNDEKTPIRWQVLERNGDELLLFSDKILDCQQYNSTGEAITWEMCSLRTWLNGEFYNAAFSSAEKKGIKECSITNPDNSDYEIDGGNDTTDYLFTLSLDEIKGYDFNESYDYYDQARHGKVTAFVKKKGLSANIDNAGAWWLRSPGNATTCPAYVLGNGCVVRNDSVDSVTSSYGVRPALRISLSSIPAYVADVGMENVAIQAASWDTVSFGTYEGGALIWRVLDVNEDEALLLSDSIVDTRKYNDEDTSVTWKGCTLRMWLNEDFYNSAFTSSQKSAIVTTELENCNNPTYGISGGDDTSDKIYLLSASDIINPDYGVPGAFNCQSDSRIACKTGVKGAWWLRTPGGNTSDAAFVRSYGFVNLDGNRVTSSYGVRPALHITLSSSAWTKANKVIAGDENAFATPTPSPTPTKAPTAPPTSTPTVSPVYPPTDAPSPLPTEESGVVPGTLQPGNLVTDNSGVNGLQSGSGTDVAQNQGENTDSTDSQVTVKKGMKFTVGNLIYKVVSDKKNKYQVYIVKVKNKKITNLTIESVVEYKGNIFRVTGIGKKFASGCTKLKKINLRSKYIKKIEKKAFAGIKSKYKVLVVKSKFKKYAKMIKKAK